MPGEGTNTKGDAADDEGPGLLLDDFGQRLTDFYSLRKTSSDEADQTLDALGANDEVDRQIFLELAAPKPLYLTDRFLEAHTLAVRSLEVLDRNGTRKPPLPRIGPLRPVLGYLVEIAAKFVVRSHLRSLTDNLLKLYIRREANSLPDDPARPLLRRARMDMERMEPAFKRNPLAIPGFLLGGAILSSILGVIVDAVEAFTGGGTGSIIATVVFVLVGMLAAYVILKGAAVAHRRIDSTTDQPMQALYETIGRAGKPPNDKSGTFAIISIILLSIAVILVPIGIGLAAL